MRWPPMFVWPLVGQANSSLLPSLLSLPVQKPEQRGPRAPRHEAKAARLRALSALSLADWRPGHGAPVQRAEPEKPVRLAGPAQGGCMTCTCVSRSEAAMYPGGVRAASFCSGSAGTKTAPPTQNWPHSLPPPSEPHLWPSVLRAGPDGLPCHPQATARRCTLPARSEDSATPRPGTMRASKATKPRAPTGLRFVRDCHEGCNPGSSHNGPLYIVQQRPHRHPLRRTPGAGGTKDNAPCALSPVAPVTLTARLLPGPQGQPAVTRASPSCILHASPSLRWFDQLGARGGKETGEPSPESSRTATETGDSVEWPSGLDPGKTGQLVFRCFCRLCSLCCTAVQSFRPHQPASSSGGPKAVPSEDSSRLPP